MENQDESYKTLKKMSEDLQNSEVKQVSNRINDILEGFDEEKEKPNKAIPELVFKHYFLPFFQDLARSKKPEDSKQNKNLMSAWIELADGPFNEVDVIDDNKGETLFTVPSLFVKNAVVLENVKNVPFNDIQQDYDRKNSINPVQANNYLNTRLSGMPKFIKNPEDNIADQERWTKIFKRYNNLNKKKEDLISKPINCDSKKVKKKIEEDLGVSLDDD